MEEVNKEWFKQDALVIARKLLGKIIEFNGKKGMVVETEAYKSDPGSHAYKITPRSKIMLESYGKIYVYLVYGMYHCLNITTNVREPGAVLIRALEPLEKTTSLTSGPGKLCKALNITKNLNNTEVNDKLKVYGFKDFSDEKIVISKRIGLKRGTNLDWRFYIKDNQFVSKK